MESVQTPPIEEFFPLERIRDKQQKALHFIDERVAGGYRDIVIEAPTGLGKSALGVACCIWAGSTDLEGQMGGYYLVTQKLLQDQLEHDFRRFVDVYKTLGASLKSASEYVCPAHGNCQVAGQKSKKQPCAQRKLNTCPYKIAYGRFVGQPVSVTNYPYFFTERSYLKRLEKRQVLVMDECHSIERQVLGFIDIVVSNKILAEWAPMLQPLPVMPDADQFMRWAKNSYAPRLKERLDFLRDQAAESDEQKVHKELRELEMYAGRLLMALQSMEEDPGNWVYWTEQTEDGAMCTAKPIDASPYTPPILMDNASLRIYMSAYVGPKNIFCRTIGLDPEKTAFASLRSSFPIENRPIHILPVGSMGRRSQDETMPVLLRKIEKIMDVHSSERGLIHVHSYKIGKAVYDFLRGTKHASRILFAENSGQRATLMMRHAKGTLPTVLISPSMTEGFSFDDDLARWQIIAKMPYASLGDPQVVAKKNRDAEWYVLQTVSTFLQAAGRIVRSETDFGATYVLDSDFGMLYERYPHFFPKWLSDAFQWH
jgi:Rad3-related DNA helicase